MYRLLKNGQEWRMAAAVVGTVSATNLIADSFHFVSPEDSTSDGYNRKASADGDAFFFATRSFPSLQITCKCESLVSMLGLATELETRGERLTQQKSGTNSPHNNAFNLKQSYEIIRVLGEGAYGLVYHAKDKLTGKDVAIKAMPREYTGQTDFEREVAALQLLSKKKEQSGSQQSKRDAGQDHIVQLYNLHRDDENYYLAMELVDGGELFDHLIAGGPFSERVAASFLRQFAEGISYIHSAGLVHGDLKPENLLLTTKTSEGGKEDMQLKLVDFGCACTHDTTKNDLHLPAQEFAVGCSFLHMVALGNQFELQRMLFEKSSLVNFRDYDFRTPLVSKDCVVVFFLNRHISANQSFLLKHLAASEGHVDICRFLVAKGAKINRTDRWLNTPLDDAHRHKHKEVLKYLRERGAKFGNNATQVHKLIEASGAGNFEEVKSLLEFGTSLDINQGDYDQRTALHLACSEGKLKVVELLLSQGGVDVNVEDRWGNRPLDDARQAKHHSAEIVKLLKAHGAKTEDSLWPFSPERKKATSSAKAEDHQTSLGTIFYWPPEMFVKGGSMPTPSTDMWAVGVTTYMVLTGTHPFDKYADKTNEDYKELIKKVSSVDEDGCGYKLLEDVVFDERVAGL
jgi:serine/threonine protein kinase